MRTTTNFKEFMSYVNWNELDVTEKRALVEAARNTDEMNYGLFRTILVDKLEDKTVVEYPLSDIGLVIDLNSRRDFIRYLEHTYMQDEDYGSYLSSLEAMEDGEPTQTRISSLPTERWFYLKNINLENKFSSCRVMYGRKPTGLYKMKPIKKSKNDQLFFGYTEQEYPSDELDKAIEAELKNSFQSLISNTSFIMFDAELRNIEHLTQQMNKETLKLQVEFIPLHNSLLQQPQIIEKEIDALFYPMPDENQQRLRTNITIVTNEWEEYSLLKNLLENTYVPFSDIIK